MTLPRPRILLVNPNRMKPPVAPLGLEYVACALEREGFEPVACDLTFADDWEAALAAAIDGARPEAVGLTIRNIDDAYFASQDFVLERTAAVARRIMELTPAPLILGGIGFSCAPAEILSFTGAPYGIAGDGEEALPLLLRRLRAVKLSGETAGAAPGAVPGAVFRDSSGAIVEIPPAAPPVDRLPPPRRRWFDNRRYFAEGGQAGIETKRGCPQRCLYCLEPHAKGAAARLRSPESVIAECRDLLDQGINVFHLCDCEFNLPPGHAHAICDALIASGLAPQLRWYTYAYPEPFDDSLARQMARAGCVGINFGVDHADEEMLRRLGRNYNGPERMHALSRLCHEAGMAVMLDLLLGGPGETRDSVFRTIEAVRAADPDRAGLSCGVRVYPRTPLARMVRAQGPLAANPHLHGAKENNENLLRPVFYVDAAIGGGIHQAVWDLVGGDPRFFVADPTQIGRNYNYNDNSDLAQAIRNGARGAYWDILRLKEAQPPNPKPPTPKPKA